MNLPFESEKEPDWKPRNHLGRDGSLTPLEKQICDVVDILEQRQDRSSRLTILTHNRVILLGFFVGILIILHGTEFVKIVKGWITSGP